jgi:hypothetical protein
LCGSFQDEEFTFGFEEITMKKPVFFEFGATLMGDRQMEGKLTIEIPGFGKPGDPVEVWSSPREQGLHTGVCLLVHGKTQKAFEIDQENLQGVLTLKQASLRSKVIRLANQKPELRKHLLPLLRRASQQKMIASVTRKAFLGKMFGWLKNTVRGWVEKGVYNLDKLKSFWSGKGWQALTAQEKKELAAQIGKERENAKKKFQEARSVCLRKAKQIGEDWPKFYVVLDQKLQKMDQEEVQHFTRVLDLALRNENLPHLNEILAKYVGKQNIPFQLTPEYAQSRKDPKRRSDLELVPEGQVDIPVGFFQAVAEVGTWHLVADVFGGILGMIGSLLD